jgi:hypothetical protein
MLRVSCWRGEFGFVGVLRLRMYAPPLFREYVALPLLPLKIVSDRILTIFDVL